MEMVRGDTKTRKPNAISVAFGIGWASPLSGKIRPYD